MEIITFNIASNRPIYTGVIFTNEYDMKLVKCGNKEYELRKLMNIKNVTEKKGENPITLIYCEQLNTSIIRLKTQLASTNNSSAATHILEDGKLYSYSYKPTKGFSFYLDPTPYKIIKNQA